MLRTTLAVIAGYAVWTAIWLTGGMTIFADASKAVGERQPITATGMLAGFLVLSVVCSLAAGAIAALVAAKKARPAALVTAILLLLTGIGVQAGAWSVMPLWYHLSFLVLLVPVTLLGARLIPRTSDAG